MNPEQVLDLEQRSATSNEPVPQDWQPTEHYMGVIGATEPTSSVAEPDLEG